MRERRLARWLAALLPPATRHDVFEPAACDLEAARVHAGRRGGSLRLILLFLDCWRLAPAEMLPMFIRDVQHAFRLLRRDLLFTAAVVLTLAIGVGANVSVFAVVNAVLLRPLPYADAERLVMIQHRSTRTGLTKSFIAIGDHVDLRTRQTAFSQFAGYGHGPTVVHGPNEAWDASALAATAELLPALGVRPAEGRAFEQADMHPGAARVAMLGYDFWQRHFGGDPGVVGRIVPIGLTRDPHRIVGIAPPGFAFPIANAADVIVPMRLPADAPAARTSGWTFAVARLAEGVTLEQAGAHLQTLSRQMEAEHPEQNQGSEYFVTPIRDAMVGETRTALVYLLAAVGLVLLIACVNVANLLAARALGRRHEMSVRVALGAGRRQILMQLVAESLALGLVACVAALGFAYWALPALVSLVPASLNLDAPGRIGIDGVVLAFASALSVGTALLFGLFSGLGLRRDATAGTLTASRGSTSGGVARTASAALVVVEIAIAIVLLAGAGLVLRSFAALLAVDPGFRTTGVVTVNLAVPPARYGDAPARAALQRRLFESLRALPGVDAVGSASVVPLTGNHWTAPLARADRPLPAGERPPEVGWQSATAGYFQALDIPLVEGRLFDDVRDGVDAPPVVIISAAARDRYFPGESPVGRRLRTGDGEAEIVGVVGSIRRAALTDEPWADLYFAQSQSPGASMTLFVRGDGNDALPAAIRATLREVEPGMLIRSVTPLAEIAGESVQVTRLVLWLMGLFAVAALALAALGIYAVMSYAVRRRMRELGTRAALGATPASLLRLVLGEGARLTMAGAAVGATGALGVGRALAGIMPDAPAADPLVLAVATSALAAVAMLACYVPARRAARVDPVRTLVQAP